MSRPRTGARKGPTAAERRAAAKEAHAAACRRVWTLSELDEQVVRSAFDAGPGGLYVPCVGHIPGIVVRLVEGGCGEYRLVISRHTHVGSWAHKGDFTLTEHYFIPNARALEMIGICPWPGTAVACEGLSSDRPMARNVQGDEA